MSEQSAPSAATNGGVRATNGGVRRRAPGAGRPIGSRSHRVTMRETLVRAYAVRTNLAALIGSGRS
jgi:hypothetical protein